MHTMRAVQVPAPGADFELVEKEMPVPGDGEVLIQVQACGICHGDAITKDGRYPGIVYPRIPGHEVVGIINACGAHTAPWQPGQRVGVGWYGGPCRSCEACQSGNLEACQRILTPGISFDGGYAEYLAVSARALAAIPASFDSLAAAPLLCAGRTTFSALRGSGARGGDLVAIQGLGGLGHLAVQFARKLGFHTVALSRGSEKATLAYQLGAHVFIDTEATQAADELQKLGGARVILATAPNSAAIAALIDGLGYDGQLVVVAAPAEPIQVTAGQLFQGRRSIRGWVGSRAEAAPMIPFSAMAGITPMIEVFPLEQAALAYARMITAKVRFRSVLTMGG
jgi:propanol-preferring alcohol dehydrogenase